MEATIVKVQPNIQNILQSNTKLFAGLVAGGMLGPPGHKGGGF